jgi:hypothetical protein
MYNGEDCSKSETEIVRKNYSTFSENCTLDIKHVKEKGAFINLANFLEMVDRGYYL